MFLFTDLQLLNTNYGARVPFISPGKTTMWHRIGKALPFKRNFATVPQWAYKIPDGDKTLRIALPGKQINTINDYRRKSHHWLFAIPINW